MDASSAADRGGSMPAIVAQSIDAFGRDEWDRLFAGTVEDWAYYRAIEQSRLARFEWLYFGIRERGELVAAVPAFITDYRLDTTLSGALRRISAAIARWFPRFLRVRLLSLGSPVGEICQLGFAPQAAAGEQRRLFELLFTEVENCSARRRVSLLAAKDAAASQDRLWSDVAAARGLRRQPSLPSAVLDIRFDSLDGYLATLSHATRKDLRRKMRASSALRIEWRDQIDDIIADVMRLYRATLARAEFTFEELTADYFLRVLHDTQPGARCATYWLDGRLVAFNLVLVNGTTLLDKFLGMDYAVARRCNLYYISWLQNVRYCIDHGLQRYEAGAGLHREKRRLGCHLAANWLWYRHRNRLLDAVFAAGERWFRLDRGDPDIAAPQTGQAARTRGKPVAAWAVFLACAALSQIAFKFAAQQTGPLALSAHWFAAALASGWLWVSIASHVGEFVLWMSILSRSALSSAFATTAVLFVVVLLASWLLFGEPLGWNKLLGSGAILVGILLLGADDTAPPGPVST